MDNTDRLRQSSINEQYPLDSQCEQQVIIAHFKWQILSDMNQND
jgi:hypothetical protein